MNKKQKDVYETKKAELIAKGWSESAADKRARKAARPFSTAHKRATVRNLALADTRFQVMGSFAI
jgi:hypothetical protein